MERLVNPIREYAWGSRTAIAALQGRPVPSPGPEAELWVGAHPSDPSRLEPTGTPLPEVIRARPVATLSAPVVDRFGPRLPYLLKLLAAAAPLSLQAHPDADRAAAGYAAEEAAAVPPDAPQRRYVDPYHKPELLVAVSEFRALCGFRDPAESAALLAGLGLAELAPVLAALRGRDLRGALAWLLRAPRTSLVTRVVHAAAARPEYELIGELAAAYPCDRGVMVALLLNQVTLARGEAIFMPPGNLHAYLGGTGVEAMASSDNVLRGGLTPKHVDPAELLRVLRYEVLPDPVRAPVPVAPGVVTWPVPIAELVLHRVRLDPRLPRVGLRLAGPRTVLCLAGAVRVDDGGRPVTLGPGEAAFGEASAPAPELRLSGSGEAYLISVPISQDARSSGRADDLTSIFPEMA